MKITDVDETKLYLDHIKIKASGVKFPRKQLRKLYPELNAKRVDNILHKMTNRNDELFNLEAAHEYQRLVNATGYNMGEPIHLDDTHDNMVTGDWHMPYLNLEWFERMLAIAERHMIPGKRRLIIGGDLMNFDAFSVHPVLLGGAPSLKTEIEAAGLALKRALRIFDEVVWLMGNHDERIIKRFNGVLTSQNMMDMVIDDKRVKISHFHFCTVQSGDEVYRITHPRNYSVNPGVIGSELALKYQQHIIGHHEHHTAKRWDRFGRYIVINNGGLFDDSKFAYVHIADSKSPVMKNGFTLLRDGHAELFGDAPFTRWADWIDTGSE